MILIVSSSIMAEQAGQITDCADSYGENTT
jgi:hypothetical protein